MRSSKNVSKELIRKKYLKLRKSHHIDISKNIFLPVKKIKQTLFKTKNSINIGIYYPIKNEFNPLVLLGLKKKIKFNTLLPVIKNNNLVFVKWDLNDPLEINNYGILEPSNKKLIFIPDICLTPLVTYDKKKYRVGYGKGFYDRYFAQNKKVVKIGAAFSWQKIEFIPKNSRDIKMDYILTEKGIEN